MDALLLVLPNDDPVERRTLLEDEDSIGLTAFTGGARTRGTLIARVDGGWREALAGGDADGAAQDAGLGRGREGAGGSTGFEAKCDGRKWSR